MFAPGRMRFDVTPIGTGVPLYASLILQLSSVTTNTAVSLSQCISLFHGSFPMSFSCEYPFVCIIGDCHNSAGHENVCATAAIYNYTEQLKSFNEDSVLVSKCKHSVLLARYDTLLVL